MGLVCSLSCAFFLPFGAGHAVSAAGRAEPRGSRPGPSRHPQCWATGHSAFHSLFQLFRGGHVICLVHASATWSGQRSVRRAAETKPTQSPLAPSLNGVEVAWGGIPPASLNSFPALLCLPCSRLPWRQVWLGTGPSGWAVAISLASPAHTHPMPQCPGICSPPPSPQGAQHFSGTPCAGHFHIHCISLGP